MVLLYRNYSDTCSAEFLLFQAELHQFSGVIARSLTWRFASG
ncbi:hypothetical protein S7335_631 [Synechococcus sp. PCC 7335]|nr:hypothetical protein S7335_631 [Synechococcus sp. PCC 7335]